MFKPFVPVWAERLDTLRSEDDHLGHLHALLVCERAMAEHPSYLLERWGSTPEGIEYVMRVAASTLRYRKKVDRARRKLIRQIVTNFPEFAADERVMLSLRHTTLVQR
jgi:hypothetical protein